MFMRGNRELSVRNPGYVARKGHILRTRSVLAYLFAVTIFFGAAANGFAGKATNHRESVLCISL
jgi:hypothetical protein